jgi:Zn-dependent M28 family amino/carboxypeptidase
MIRRFLVLTGALALTLGTLGTAAQQSSTTRFDGVSWWSYVKVLADDNMEGRETGSEGLRRAEAYTVEQLKKSGLEPAGVNGFYQTVKFDKRQVDEKNSFAALVRDGKTEPLALGEDAYFSTAVDMPSAEIDAPLVFVGYGLKIPEKNDDDYAGLDVKGKIAVYISGSPEDVPAPLSAHSQTTAERGNALRSAGAIGVIRLFNPASMDIPWARIALNRNAPAMQLADPSLQDSVGMKVALTFNPAQAEKLFTGSGHTFAELAALAAARKQLPRFPLAASLKAHAAIESKIIESDNIIAKLPGSDPVLKKEYVVLSAHIDHIGIGAPINGDSIYNGAMDNGSGSALLLDIAAQLKTHPEKLRRSVLFIFVTAEEKGLLGSRYFTAHPTVDARSIIADINTDMFLPIVPLKTLLVLGIDESTLGTRATVIAGSLGVHAIPDPMPLRNIFIRSDQYNFVLHGVPSVMMSVWAAPGSPEEKIFETWLSTRYHAPSDDVNQPVDLRAAALFEEIALRLLVDTANADAKPHWNDDSFFRRYATGGK